MLLSQRGTFLLILVIFLSILFLSFSISLFFSDSSSEQQIPLKQPSLYFLESLSQPLTLQAGNNPDRLVTTDDLSLQEYPSFLLQDKRFTGFIVVGANASNDMLSAASQLEKSLGITFEKARSEELEISKDILGSVIGEDPSMNVRDLPSLLQSQTIWNKYNTYNYTQTLFLPAGSIELAIDTFENEHIPREMLVIPANSRAYNYKITFQPALEGKHLSGAIEGMEDMTFRFLGKEYVLVQTKHPRQNTLSLTFITNEADDILEEGASKTYFVNGKNYTLELVVVSQTPKSATFFVNGKITDAIEENDIAVLDHGLISLGLKNVYDNEAGEVAHDKVHFFLGNHVTFEDTDTTLDDFSSSISMNNEHLPNTEVNLGVTLDEGIFSGAVVKLSSFEVEYTPTRTLYVNKKMSDEIQEKEFKPAVLFDAFDVEFAGVTTKGGQDKGTLENFVLYPADRFTYRLQFNNLMGQIYDLPVLSCRSDDCSTISYGKRGSNTFRALVVNETQAIAINDNFFFNFNSRAHIMQLDSIDLHEQTISLRDMAKVLPEQTPAIYTVSYNASGLGKFELDDGIFTVNLSDNDNQSIFVDMNGDGDFSDTSLTFLTKAGSFAFSATNEGLARIEFRTSELYRNSTKDFVYVPVFFNQNNALDINGSDITGDWRAGFNMTTSSLKVNGPLEIEDTDVEVGWTEYGLRGTLMDNDFESQSNFTLSNPKGQLFGYVDVYGTNQRQVIKRDHELKTKKDHIILLGNACTNTFIKAFLNNPEPCDKDLIDSEGTITLYSNAFDGDKHVIIVSGKTDAAIINAVKVLSAYKEYNLTGAALRVKKQQEFALEQ